jgi:catechol 2,3-dioxygenase-like lactoylglutathione lyase family enzyme
MSPQLDVVGIVVKDMKASLDFYRALGLAIPEGAEKEDHVELKVGGLRFAWDTIGVIQSFDPDWTPPSGGHRMSLGFLCASPAEVDETYKQVTGLGYESHMAPWDAFWGQRYATVLDPDGNTVDLFAALSGG